MRYEMSRAAASQLRDLADNDNMSDADYRAQAESLEHWAADYANRMDPSWRRLAKQMAWRAAEMRQAMAR